MRCLRFFSLFHDSIARLRRARIKAAKFFLWNWISEGKSSIMKVTRRMEKILRGAIIDPYLFSKGGM